MFHPLKNITAKDIKADATDETDSGERAGPSGPSDLQAEIQQSAFSLTDYQLMVISNGTNCVSRHQFPCCHNEFTFLFPPFFPSSHSACYKSSLYLFVP